MSQRQTGISILDLGCGFGATLSYLVGHQNTQSSIRYFGITISEYQKNEAQLNLKENARIKCGDFQELSALYSNIDVIYAIESIVHSPDLKVLFTHLNTALNPGGVLIIIDDFLANVDTQKHSQLIKDYQDNWITPGLIDVVSFVEMAYENGFELRHSISLRSYIKQSFKGLMGRLLYKIGLRRSSNVYLKSVIGGAARQNALLKGLFDYRLMVFTKV